MGYGGLGPFSVAAIRFAIAGAVFAALVPLLRARWPHSRTEWLLIVWIGVALYAGDYGLIYWGEQLIDSSLTAILFAILPLLTAVLAHFYVPGERLTARKLSGTLLALAGVAALFADRLRIDRAALGPMLAIVASAWCAAAAGVASKRHGGSLHPAALNAPAMLIGALVLAAVSAAAGERFALPRDLSTWWAILYLALAGSVIAFLVYFTLLKTWSVTTLSFISVFTPVVAVVLGFVFLDERPTRWTAAGGALVLSGVALAISSPGGASHAS